MKHCLIALAAVMATGAVSAQSSVAIGGVLDVGVVKPIGAKGLRLDAANGNNSLFFRGSEDLGGGLKAVFMLRMNFSPESGGQDGDRNGRPLFQSESTLGLTGPFGAVKLGRSLTAGQSLAIPYDNFNSNLVAAAIPSALAGRYMTAPQLEDPRDLAGLGRTDGITYASPALGGLTVQGTYGFKDSQGSGARYTGRNALLSLGLSYTTGPFRADFGAERNRAGDRFTWLGGIYDTGTIRLLAAYGVYSPLASINNTIGRIVGINVPVGAATLKAVYGHNKTQTLPAARSRLGLGVDYFLSKRTNLYVTIGHEGGTANTIAGVTQKNGYSLGLRHTF